jgi:hypothetical protein
MSELTEEDMEVDRPLSRNMRSRTASRSCGFSDGLQDCISQLALASSEVHYLIGKLREYTSSDGQGREPANRLSIESVERLFHAKINEVEKLREDLKAADEAKKALEDSQRIMRHKLADMQKRLAEREKELQQKRPVTTADLKGSWTLDEMGSRYLVKPFGFKLEVDGTGRGYEGYWSGFCQVWSIMERMVILCFQFGPSCHKSWFVGVISEDRKTIHGYYYTLSSFDRAHGCIVRRN